MAIFSSTGLLIALVKFRPFTTMSEVEVNQWDELSQFLFFERKFINLLATNEELLEGFMFAIGCRKCSMKNDQFGPYGSLGKIENAKDEWRKQGANLRLVGCILVNYEANISANKGAFEFASALTFTMNGFKNSPHLDKDASLQFLTPVQDPNALHAKPCAVNPYAGAAFQQFQQFLTPVQAPNASHAKSLCMYRLPTIPIIAYARAALQQLPHFLMRVQAPNASHPNPYASAGS
ncbi:hypothetical protein O181_027554 [Austropuccinia psidii MF-1]|uniref:Tet-like 2OG-Fe(II) oxygenase domain-containing protein n=1 Tax=Austropuccinia psidii MF-1 TaxID=1389203 RepID=A0A9Q3H2Q6_9BASI|nr:hypothetical protein [Austropuccinia psidii MF-1]